MADKLRPWVVHIRGFDAYTFWAKSRSAAKYQAAKACCEAGYFHHDIGALLRMGFENVYLDHNAERERDLDPRTPEYGVGSAT
jgi:hypothetical protein